MNFRLPSDPDVPANTLTVTATLDALEDVASFVQAAAVAAGLDAPAQHRLRLAADELTTNVIMHAYRHTTTPGTIRLHFDLDDKTLRVILEDTGPAFDPRQAPPPSDLHLPAHLRRIGGLGIFLALGNVDQFAYERIGDRNRSVLIMNRARRPEVSESE